MKEFTTSQDKFLTFIVPVYNAQKYLSECLDSLLDQNIEHACYEIICVNDGSTDNSLEILDEYQKKYTNIKVINKENAGVSSARNMGLEYSNGEYIWFVDSDDCIKANCLNQIKDFLIKNKPECLKFDYVSVDDNFKHVKDEMPLLSFEKLKGSISSSNVWNMITKSDIIKEHKLSFNTSMKYGEDTLFQFFVYLYMQNDNSYKIDIPLYYYRINPTSAMRKKDVESMNCRARDFLTMAYTYQQAYQKRLTSDPIKLNNILKRQYLATKAYLSTSPKTSLNLKELLIKLKQDKLYPYPFIWWNLKAHKKFKAKCIEFLYLFLKWEFVYNIYCLIGKKIFKPKK